MQAIALTQLDSHSSGNFGAPSNPFGGSDRSGGYEDFATASHNQQHNNRSNSNFEEHDEDEEGMVGV